MRIKIIGDNNCARATRHLLRLAGFAVTEFLPAEAVTQGLHSGYAITIETSLPARAAEPGEVSADAPSISRARHSSFTQEGEARTQLAPAHSPLTPAVASNLEAAAGAPSPQPDSPTHGQPAKVHGEAPSAVGGASSPALFSEACGGSIAMIGLGDGGVFDGGSIGDTDGKGRQAEACPTWNIHFDSVDCALEAAVLRHVTQLAAAPVVVDRPGGKVHSERELRIILPATGDARADEAAAVAVEFGVLRGLLDLTRRPLRGGLQGGAAGEDLEGPGKSGQGRGGRKSWWIFGGLLLGAVVAVFCAGLQASPKVSGAVVVKGVHTSACGDGITTTANSMIRAHGLAPYCVDSRGGVFCSNKNPQAEACATGDRFSRFAQPAVLLGDRSVRRAVLRVSAVVAAAEPQGQFSTGQGVRIFDGANSLVLDPCQAQTKLFASINQTGNAQLVAGTASRKIYICSIHVVVAAATSVALVEGTGTVCGTGTAGVSGFGGATPATGWNFMANGGIALGSGAAAVGAEATSADNLCLFNSGSGQVSGGISYVVE